MYGLTMQYIRKTLSNEPRRRGSQVWQADGQTNRQTDRQIERL